MSILQMFLKPAIKEIKANPKIQAALQQLEVAENKIVPILAKIDQAQLAQQIAVLSGGKITTAEVLLLEQEIGNVLQSLEHLATEAEAVANT